MNVNVQALKVMAAQRRSEGQNAITFNISEFNYISTVYRDCLHKQICMADILRKITALVLVADA
jgi:hypothetical protein